MKKKIFITGGAGFIGANLVKYLLDRGGFDITAYDNLSLGSEANLNRAIRDSKKNGEMSFIKGDILDHKRLEAAVKGHDAVVHLAAHTRVIESLKDPEKNFKTNVIGTFNILEAIRKEKIEKFIFASSNAAVGEQPPPINEKAVPRPISPYGAGKLYGEALSSSYYYSYGVKTVSFRFANVYGPYSDHKGSVVAKFIRRIKEARPIVIYGDGSQTRDFIHAEDICQAIFLSLAGRHSGGVPWGEVFQVATSRETSINELTEIMKKVCDREIGLSYGDVRRGEIKRNYSDISKIRTRLAFSPSINLEDGIKDFWKAAGSQ